MTALPAQLGLRFDGFDRKTLPAASGMGELDSLVSSFFKRNENSIMKANLYASAAVATYYGGPAAGTAVLAVGSQTVPEYREKVKKQKQAAQAAQAAQSNPFTGSLGPPIPVVETEGRESPLSNPWVLGAAAIGLVMVMKAA